MIYIYNHIYNIIMSIYAIMNTWKQCALPVITLSPQWLCGNSCTWAHELPQSHCGDNRKGTVFHDCIYITPILLL